tara:strand:+ start:13166 stop:13723 length:558 start_codon:yes stop_codon:yes gene_type:complete
MKKLLLVLVLFAFVGLNATPLENIAKPDKHKTEVCTSDNYTDATIVLNADFVYLSMEKSKVFNNHVLGENFTYGLDFGKGNSKFVSIPYEDILKQLNEEYFKNELLGNFNNESNALDKIIDQIPDNLNLQELDAPYQFILNQKEFNKIEHLLDKNSSYKGFKVEVFEKAPDDAIYLRQKQKSDFY